ncbi:uncharacterized protein LOC129792459 [Lutzomyia longipalpis]|uniref:uncharacterized protein LOC129792459 n=1 Tax=Lutzomyia longipalpis TaxID=7200 RepID=UPI0024846609|nr:uncharacterized protein LOC129792459 [Lutzomyia longipalpis]
MAKTPTRHNSSVDSLNLSFKSPKSPSQDGSPLTKRLIVILQNLTTNYASWRVYHRKGINICRAIETAKCKALEKQLQFPDDLVPFCKELESLLKSLEDIVENTRGVVKQISALVKLDRDANAVLKSWNSRKSEKFAEEVLRAFEEEFRIKKLVKQNIAFALSHAELVHMSCVWEYQFYVNADIAMGFAIIEAEMR